jgi:hypothetical protein
MIKVKFEKYHSDLNFTRPCKTFENLEALGDWILEQMNVSSAKDWIYGRMDDKMKYITFYPEGPGWNYKVRLIENENGGILFSDGDLTEDQQHAAKSVCEWWEKFKASLEKRTFNFVEE